jgi:hypothetical protein
MCRNLAQQFVLSLYPNKGDVIEPYVPLSEVSVIRAGYMPSPSNGACLVLYHQNSESLLPIFREVFTTDGRAVAGLCSRSIMFSWKSVSGFTIWTGGRMWKHKSLIRSLQEREVRNRRKTEENKKGFDKWKAIRSRNVGRYQNERIRRRETKRRKITTRNFWRINHS